jgi:nucleolar protein 56
MKLYIVTTFIGSFGIDESNSVVAFRPFPKEPEKIAEQMKLSEIEIIEDEKKVQSDAWRKGFKEFVYAVRKIDAKSAEPGNPAEKFLMDNLRQIALDKKYVKDQIEFNQLLTKVNLELTRVKIKRAIGRDVLIIHVNGAIEELDKSINIFVERLREIYGMHFPEMDRAVLDHERFVKIVERYGQRDRIEDQDVKPLAAKSMGIDLGEEDIREIQNFAAKIREMFELRAQMQKYLETLVRGIAPNFTELAGVSTSARLIAKAGGMEKLARMPSSTIQLIGAEKALFRFLHGKGRSPRFGLLFNHPLIQNAPEWLRGRVARVIASKLSIAAKMDFYSKEYKADKLKQDMMNRIKEMSSQKPHSHPTQPERPKERPYNQAMRRPRPRRR